LLPFSAMSSSCSGDRSSRFFPLTAFTLKFRRDVSRAPALPRCLGEHVCRPPLSPAHYVKLADGMKPPAPFARPVCRPHVGDFQVQSESSSFLQPPAPACIFCYGLAFCCKQGTDDIFRSSSFLLPWAKTGQYQFFPLFCVHRRAGFPSLALPRWRRSRASFFQERPFTASSFLLVFTAPSAWKMMGYIPQFL